MLTHIHHFFDLLALTTEDLIMGKRKRLVQTHQFGLFGFVRPNRKVPISEEEVKRAQAMFDSGDLKGAAAGLREIRYKLENFERRIDVRRNGNEKEV